MCCIEIVDSGLSTSPGCKVDETVDVSVSASLTSKVTGAIITDDSAVKSVITVAVEVMEGIERSGELLYMEIVRSNKRFVVEFYGTSACDPRLSLRSSTAAIIPGNLRVDRSTLRT